MDFNFVTNFPSILGNVNNNKETQKGLHHAINATPLGYDYCSITDRT